MSGVILIITSYKLRPIISNQQYINLVEFWSLKLVGVKCEGVKLLTSTGTKGLGPSRFIFIYNNLYINYRYLIGIKIIGI
jgi:hypothetical protein